MPPPPHFSQTELLLPSAQRGYHVITKRVVDALPKELASVRCGLLHVFIQHTSASLVLGENADPDVRVDFETWARLAVPEGRGAPWVHTDEGDDDMPAHIKAAVIIGGPSLTLPVRDGKLALGTWQGIWLAEHRDSGGRRNLILTLQGST